MSDEEAAQEWARELHGAFYAGVPVRGVNRFLEMEEVLERVFAQLSGDASFWEFAVRVVTLVAREQEQPAVEDAEGYVVIDGLPAKQASKGKKQRRAKKCCRPFVPLAFMAVNALRKVCERDESLELQKRCHEQGAMNELLRDFCLRGLKDLNYVVSDI